MQFNRFGNMAPPIDMMGKSYKLIKEPFKITDNIYYVGNQCCSSHLIDTGDGLALLDTPLITDFAYLIDSIYRLGFNFRDIKYVVISHAHIDHYACANAIKNMTGAKIFLSKKDSEWMKNSLSVFERMHRSLKGFNESFIPDVELEDGQIIDLGNTKIKCVLIPGHTIGTMAHFWDTTFEGEKYRVGIYGGSGFWSLSKTELKNNEMDETLQKDFSKSIAKVWNEQVDIMLGNHPFHNDTFFKRDRVLTGEKNAFIDNSEWHRFLTELRTKYEEFLNMNEDEMIELNKHSWFREYHEKKIF